MDPVWWRLAEVERVILLPLLEASGSCMEPCGARAHVWSGMVLWVVLRIVVVADVNAVVVFHIEVGW